MDLQALRVTVQCKAVFEMAPISRYLVIKSERDSPWQIRLREPDLRYLPPPTLPSLNIHYVGNRDAFEEE